MKKVLWVSRHLMTEEQYSDLCRGLDDDVELIHWQGTVGDVKELCPALKEADAVAAVLPPELLGELLEIAEGRPVLRSINERSLTEPKDGTEPQVIFCHKCWEKVLKIEIVTERL